MNKQYIIAVAVVLGLGIGGYAVAEVATSQLSACVKKNGEVRLIVPGFTKKDECKSEEKLVNWSSSGEQKMTARLKNGNGEDLGEIIGAHRDGGGELVYVTYYEPENVVLAVSTPIDGSQYQISHGTVEFDCLGRPYFLNATDANRPNNQFAFFGEIVSTGNDRVFALTDDLRSVSVDCPALSGYVAREVQVPAIVSPVRVSAE